VKFEFASIIVHQISTMWIDSESGLVHYPIDRTLSTKRVQAPDTKSNIFSMFI
jgi:hypothetical protein